ncbi:MAG: hypothetical protein OXF02_05945 [Simkaniaceae bacterium]|nr:hypothetical protein [Simkaniaceae bacterium]
MNYFRHNPGVKHLAICSAIGGVLGGCVGFGIGAVPRATIGAVVDATLVGGLILSFLYRHHTLGSSIGGGARDGGGSEGDSESIDGGSTTPTAEEGVEAISVPSDGYDGGDESEPEAGGGSSLPGGSDHMKWGLRSDSENPDRPGTFLPSPSFSAKGWLLSVRDPGLFFLFERCLPLRKSRLLPLKYIFVK